MFTPPVTPSRSLLTLLAVVVLPLHAALAVPEGAIESVSVVQGSDTTSLLVSGGFGEDAKIFTDRVFEYINTNNAPSLIGADYIQLQNVARDDNPFEVQVTLDTTDTTFSTVDMYLLIDIRVGTDAARPNPMPWLSTNGWTNLTAGKPTSELIATNETEIHHFNLWHQRFEAPASGPWVVSTFAQADGTSRNMYGIVAVAVPEPSAVIMLMMAAPLLLRRRRQR